jgi:integrase
MPLKLVKPGKRGNKVWYARGTVAGKRYEITTNTTDKSAAEISRANIEARLLSNAGLSVISTYGEATHLYLEKRKNEDIPRWELEIHLRLCKEIGRKLLSEINQIEARRVAEDLYPNAKASTRNRWIIQPIASVMHYASNSGKCPWVRFQKYREERPKPRAVSKDVAAKIINAAGKQERKAELKQLICLWMFKHGNRISEIISVKGEDINLSDNNFRLYISKTKRWKDFYLDKQVKTALREIWPKGLPTGRIFPWTHRWSVYKWLRPMCRGLGIAFTPHAARHSLGTWYAAEGAGLRATMARLGHDDVKSSMRYQNEDIEITRQVNQRIGKIGGPQGANHGKRKR